MAEDSQNVSATDKPARRPPIRKPASATPGPARKATLTSAKLNLAGEDRQQLIAEAAYFRAEQRGFRPGGELDDWLAAEIEVDALLGADDDRA